MTIKDFLNLFLVDDEGKEFTKKEIIKTILGVVVMFGVLIIASCFE
jgi:hypothetical protein